MTKMDKITELMERKNPPLLTLKKRSGTVAIPALHEAVDAELSGIPDEKRQVILGLLFLWHDLGDAAHTATEKYEGQPDSDLLHSFFHRREGDYGNSEYWLRETGHHPLFDVLHTKVNPLLENEEALRRKILPNGKWDAKGFVRAIKEQPDSPLLRQVQAEEFLCYCDLLRA